MSRRTFPPPVLLGDIGGTNARFTLLGADGRTTALPRGLIADHSGPVALLNVLLAASSIARPRSALLAVAAPVEGPVVPLTNAPWVIDAGEVRSALDLDEVTLVNDYVPVAALLADGGQARFERIGPPCAPSTGPKVVLGPGTGLGAAALLPAGDRLVVVSTEAGHMEFGPAEGEDALWRGIERSGGRVAAEQILSGPGLLRLYRALAPLEDAAPSLQTSAAVVEAGLAGDDSLSRRALDLFAGLLGRFAGDLALAFGATGGVVLAGAIAGRIAPVLAGGSFRRSFERKAPQEGLMRRIPTALLLDSDPALPGLAAIAAAPDRFAFRKETVAR